jgi:hypothetical protein
VFRRFVKKKRAVWYNSYDITLRPYTLGPSVKSVLLDVRVHSRTISFAQGTDLYMANIGDSRAVLGSRDCAGSGMVAVQLTVDLKPDVPSTPPHSP